MPDCVLPLSPKTLESILAGQAHVLPLRVMPARIMEGERLYLCSNNALHAVAVVRGRHTIEGCNLSAIARASARTESELVDYWAGARRPGYFVLGQVYHFPKPRAFDTKRPIQNFTYLDAWTGLK